MVLENAKEMWTETPRLANGQQGRKVNKDRFISKMYVSIPLPKRIILTLVQVPQRRFGYPCPFELRGLTARWITIWVTIKGVQAPKIYSRSQQHRESQSIDFFTS